jgi:hypothetical protein
MVKYGIIYNTIRYKSIGGKVMGIYSFNVMLKLDEVIKKLDSEIIKGTITEKIDFHEIHSQSDNKAVLMVYGKKYFRAGNRLTLTICLEELVDKTYVHVIGIGGIERTMSGEGEIIERFTNLPREILKEYIVE